MGNPDSTHVEGWRQRDDPAGWQEPDGHAGLAGRSLFAPGPDSDEWRRIIQQHPELAPALEPAFRGVADGVAFDMDDSRAPRLKCIGNGVVALQAAVAFAELGRRAGF